MILILQKQIENLLIWRPTTRINSCPSLTPKDSGVPVTRSLILFVMLCRSLFVLCPFSLGRCVVCTSSICRFWLLVCYLQALLTSICFYTLKVLLLIRKKKPSKSWIYQNISFLYYNATIVMATTVPRINSYSSQTPKDNSSAHSFML